MIPDSKQAYISAPSKSSCFGMFVIQDYDFDVDLELKISEHRSIGSMNIGKISITNLNADYL